MKSTSNKTINKQVEKVKEDDEFKIETSMLKKSSIKIKTVKEDDVFKIQTQMSNKSSYKYNSKSASIKTKKESIKKVKKDDGFKIQKPKNIKKQLLIRLSKLDFYLTKSNFNSRYDLRHTKNRKSSFIVKPDLKSKTNKAINVRLMHVKIKKL